MTFQQGVVKVTVLNYCFYLKEWNIFKCVIFFIFFIFEFRQKLKLRECHIVLCLINILTLHLKRRNSKEKKNKHPNRFLILCPCSRLH